MGLIIGYFPVFLCADGVGDYVGDDFKGEYQNPHKSHEFCWGIGDVVSSLLDAGLVLDHLKEYPFSNGWKVSESRRLYFFIVLCLM